MKFLVPRSQTSPQHRCSLPNNINDNLIIPDLFSILKSNFLSTTQVQTMIPHKLLLEYTTLILFLKNGPDHWQQSFKKKTFFVAGRPKNSQHLGSSHFQELPHTGWAGIPKTYYKVFFPFGHCTKSRTKTGNRLQSSCKQ